MNAQLKKAPSAAPTRKMKFAAVSLALGILISSIIRAAFGEEIVAALEPAIPVYAAALTDLFLMTLAGVIGWSGGYLAHDEAEEGEPEILE